MNSENSRSARLHFNAGMRALQKHNPARALPLLRSAVDELGPESRALLSKHLYWLAIALFKLGKNELHIKALASAQKLAPRGRIRNAYCRASNGYGMSRAACAEHDDYRAFFAVHIERYLRTVSGGAFSSKEEQEAIMTLIAQAWLRVKDDVLRGSPDCGQKLAAFRSVQLAFPVLTERTACRVLVGDFDTTNAAMRCECGSGLPRARCCGRVSVHRQAQPGSF
ncbi:MAG TPA: hypothetical protein PLC54_04315 [Spirochaetales bacterium]|nr:hypothetical protein [Spirochaetales bacterium]